MITVCQVSRSDLEDVEELVAAILTCNETPRINKNRGTAAVPYVTELPSIKKNITNNK